MNNQWLTSFIMVAENGSFSKAAKNLFISTPSLVQQINLMEKELGFAVFVRNHKGVSLTPAGKSFLVTAKTIQDIYRDGLEKARNMADGCQKEIAFAFAAYQFPEYIMTLLRKLQEENSRIKIRLIDIPMSEQTKAVRHGRVDVCLLAKPSEEYLVGLEYKELLQDTYSFCMNDKHPLAGKRKITQHDLAGTMVVYGDYPYLEQKFEEALPPTATLKKMPSEYSLGARFNIAPNELFVIHSQWAEPFSRFHRVVASDIPAGSVGFVYQPQNAQMVKRIWDYLRKENI
ncbi:LysR family transcriptional regulator [Megasphaera sp.]|uniref:LysR family transcriptional regulator n=1 Tax=Megasphaera sp. TaxID=2023260 RepID=UPI0027BA14EE|nr:LysR family transcriptional regulator [Megasphaera sp.]